MEEEEANALFEGVTFTVIPNDKLNSERVRYRHSHAALSFLTT